MSKRDKFINKKSVQMALNVTTFMAFVMLIIGLLYHICDKYFKHYLYNIDIIGRNIFLASGLSFLVMLLVTIALWGIYVFRQFFLHVGKYQGEKCFESIDFFADNLEECNEYYRDRIRVVDRVYKSDPELKKLVQDKKLDSLYTRKAYLENKLDVLDNSMQIAIALGISAVIAIAQAGIDSSELGYIIIAFALIVICFIIKYSRKGKGDSYNYNIYEHELELLKEKISLVYKNLEIDEGGERILKRRKEIINLLADLYWNEKKYRFKRRKFISTSQALYGLPILQDLQDAEVAWARINVCRSKVSFPLVIEDGEYKFVNEYYEKVYKMLQML